MVDGGWVFHFKKNKSVLQIYFVACSYSDYEQQMHGDIPEKWLKTFNKFL